MKTKLQQTAPLGEVVVAAFDKAARYSANPEKVARLATAAVVRMLRRAGKDIIIPGPEIYRGHHAT
jgi:fructose-1-phosphate kinase PfkB-like protein